MKSVLERLTTTEGILAAGLFTARGDCLAVGGAGRALHVALAAGDVLRAALSAATAPFASQTTALVARFEENTLVVHRIVLPQGVRFLVVVGTARLDLSMGAAGFPIATALKLISIKSKLNGLWFHERDPSGKGEVAVDTSPPAAAAAGHAPEVRVTSGDAPTEPNPLAFLAGTGGVAGNDERVGSGHGHGHGEETAEGQREPEAIYVYEFEDHDELGDDETTAPPPLESGFPPPRAELPSLEETLHGLRSDYESGQIPAAPETTRSLDKAPGF